MTILRMSFAWLDTRGYKYTLRICDAYCSSTTATAAGTRIRYTCISRPVGKRGIRQLNCRLRRNCQYGQILVSNIGRAAHRHWRVTGSSAFARWNKAGRQFCATDIRARWRGTKQLIVCNVPRPLHTLFPDITPHPPPRPFPNGRRGKTRPRTSMHRNQLTN